MRVSTETQVQNNGTQSQKVAIMEYCKQNNIELSGVFEDLGISGTVTDRPALLDLLNTIEKDDKILVLNTSRLWRDDNAKIIIRQQIMKTGAHVMSIEQPTYDIYTKDPNEFLINSIMELLDQYDRLAIAMKMAKGRRAKAKKGEKACGLAPIGYKWINADIVTDNQAADIVKDIFKAYVDLNSLQKVADYCATKGYKTQRGNNYSKATLKKMLNNDFYIGIVTHNGNKTKGVHTPIIDRGLFDKVQSLLTKTA
jgi:DNA invertase Pin-like site-specific DNA recombinase